MALTRELLAGNTATAALSEDVINAIVQMSQNDEASVIGQKTGEIYGGLDADILAVSGIAKNGAEKTYEYAKRVIGDIKAKADGIEQLNTKITELTNEKSRLEKVIADGGSDTETKKALARAQSDLASVTKNYTDLKAEFDTAKDKHAKELFGVRLDGEFAKATSGIKFKANLPETVTRVIMSQAIEKVKGMFPEYIDDGKGGKVLAFKEKEDGAILRNNENNLNPFTANELIRRELKAFGVLDEGRKQTGTGIEPASTGGGGGATIDLSGVRTQYDASEVIAKSLLSKGLSVGSREYQEELSKAWKDNNVNKLPLR